MGVCAHALRTYASVLYGLTCPWFTDLCTHTVRGYASVFYGVTVSGFARGRSTKLNPPHPVLPSAPPVLVPVIEMPIITADCVLQTRGGVRNGDSVRSEE